MITNPMCLYCARRLRSPSGCEAFPLGIPTDVLSGQFDHRQPHDGDGGLTFEEQPDLSREQKMELKQILKALP